MESRMHLFDIRDVKKKGLKNMTWADDFRIKMESGKEYAIVVEKETESQFLEEELSRISNEFIMEKFRNLKYWPRNKDFAVIVGTYQDSSLKYFDKIKENDIWRVCSEGCGIAADEEIPGGYLVHARWFEYYKMGIQGNLTFVKAEIGGKRNILPYDPARNAAREKEKTGALVALGMDLSFMS